MANTQAMCTSFKVELLTGTHAFGTAPTRATTAADSFKAALFLTSATINATTTIYNSTGEVSGTNYTAGGISTGAFNAPTSTSTTAFTQPTASLTFGSSGSPLTLSTAFDCVLIYNSTQSNKAVSVHTFSSQTITAGVFTLTLPTNDSTNALLRIA